MYVYVCVYIYIYVYVCTHVAEKENTGKSYLVLPVSYSDAYISMTYC